MKIESQESVKLSYSWLVLGTVMMYFSNWNWAVPLATWLFSLFLIRFSRTQKKRTGLPILCVVSIIVGIASMWKLLAIGAIPPSFRIISGVAVGIVFFLPFLADRLITPKITGFVATLVFPCSWTALEYIKSLGNGSWGSLAYTQYGNLPLMQLVSITGIWGLAFLITWFASVVNFAWEQQFSWLKIRKVVSIYSLIFLFVFLYGYSRLASSAEPTDKICVATVTSQQDFVSRFYEPDWTDRKLAYKTMQKDLDYFLDTTRKSARAGAQIVFWQEYALSVMEENEEQFVDRIKKFARDEQIYLGVAIGLFPLNYPDKPWQNKLIWVDRDGQVIDEYLKLKPAPPLEPIIPGEGGISILDTAYGKIASIICADLDYP
ncbi:nitrilase-related carbon-nitrogen hydrolase, partial [Anaerotignum sp.]|uniref:nitrilase-related carbon-nitrogen hydrolase n=1 Tax=Anaerotignum sp. TaxID=2039241 RepID=UPI0027149FBF